MTEPLPGPDELIDKAARVLHAKRCTVPGCSGGSAAPSDIADVRILHAAGLLADPGLQAELEQEIAELKQEHGLISGRLQSVTAELEQWIRIARERNTVAREAANLRDGIATARQETVDARELAEMRAEDRTALDIKLEDVTAERDLLLWLHAEGQRQLDEMAIYGTEDLRLALWLHAEAVWQRDLARELLADVSERFDAELERLRAELAADPSERVWMLRSINRQLGAERDQLQARLDAIFAVLDPDAGMGCEPFSDGRRYFREDNIRTALQGDQPTEPEEPHEDAYLFVRDDFGVWLVSATSTEDAVTLFKRDRGETFRGVFREVTPSGSPSSPLPVSGEQATEADFAPFVEEAAEFAELTLPAAVEAFHLVESEGDHLPLADRARMWLEGQPKAEEPTPPVEKHAYEDDAAHNWAGICRVCSYPDGGPQHLSGAPEEQR